MNEEPQKRLDRLLEASNRLRAAQKWYDTTHGFVSREKMLKAQKAFDELLKKELQVKKSLAMALF